MLAGPPAILMENAMTKKQKNEGEGNRTAAKQYNQATEKFVRAGKVAGAAQRAKKALNSPEAADLAKAEDIGRAPAEHNPRTR
jgi:hypothetical protein